MPAGRLGECYELAMRAPARGGDFLPNVKERQGVLPVALQFYAIAHGPTAMLRALSLLLSVLCLLTRTVCAQGEPSPDRSRVFVGTSAFVLYNLVPDPNTPRFAQLNVGYRLSDRDDISVEAITWQYYGPKGRPYGPDYESASSNFPGRVRAYGIGLAVRRVLWRDLYAALHSTPMRQEFLDDEGERIQTGFILFNTARVGYEFRLLRDRMFLQPSMAVTFWPVNTNLPESFQVEEDKWPRYFLFEPGLHVGINL